MNIPLCDTEGEYHCCLISSQPAAEITVDVLITEKTAETPNQTAAFIHSDTEPCWKGNTNMSMQYTLENWRLCFSQGTAKQQHLRVMIRVIQYSVLFSISSALLTPVTNIILR